MASLILVAGLLGSRLLGLARNAALADTFGAGPALDAYFAAFRLPDALFQVLVGSALGSAFLPTFTRLFATVSPEAAWRLASAALTLSSAAGAAAAVVGFLAAPWVVPATVPGFALEHQRLTVELTRVMLLSTAAFCASGMVTGVLQSRSHFLLPAVAPWLYNLSIIGATLALGPRLGVQAAAWGVAAGAVLHLAVQLPGLAAIGMRWHLAGPRTEGVAAVGRLMAPRVLALGAAQVNWLVLTVLGSSLGGGAVAALNYGWALAMLPLGLFGMAPATAAFPALAAAAAQQRWGAFRTTLADGLRVMLFLALPASAALALVGSLLVEALFQRGAFGPQATALTAGALAGFAAGLAAHVVLELASRAAYAMADTWTPLLFALLGMALNVTLGLALAGPLGVVGLALALSLASLAEAGGLLFVVARRVPGWGWGRLLPSAARAAVATAALAAAVWAVQGALAGRGLPPAVALAATAGAGGAAWLAAAAAVGSSELRWLQRRGAPSLE